MAALQAKLDAAHERIEELTDEVPVVGFDGYLKNLEGFWGLLFWVYFLGFASG